VTYRQLVDGKWFPAYTRVDETLEFPRATVHMKEVIKYKDYKRADAKAESRSSPRSQ
jgi:hypothetical protein